MVVREVAVGFRRLGIDPGECFVDCNIPVIQEVLRSDSDPRLKESIEAMCRYSLADNMWYRKICQESLSEKYGFGRVNMIKFIDLLVLGDDNVWVVEVKPKLNYEALGQVLVYKDLLGEDHPELGELKTAIIVCEESDPIIEKTCEKHGIKIIHL